MEAVALRQVVRRLGLEAAERRAAAAAAEAAAAAPCCPLPPRSRPASQRAAPLALCRRVETEAAESEALILILRFCVDSAY